MREFPFVGCHRRLLFRGIRPDTMRARFQMHPCPDLSRRCERRSSIANALVTSAHLARSSVLEGGRLRFHPALGYNYSGEHGASKVVTHSRCLLTNDWRSLLFVAVIPTAAERKHI